MLNLPTITSPVYEAIIPSTGDTFHYRPFILKEYKALLQCIESNTSSEFINTMIAVINACTFNKLDVDKLTVFDVDYMFIKIRSKSVSDIIPIGYRCNNIIQSKTNPEETEVCGQQFSYSLDLNKTYILNIEEYKKTQVVELTPNLFIKLRSPSFSKYRKTVYSDVKTDNQLLEYAFACVDSIVHEERIMLPEVDFTQELFVDFIDNLPANNVTKIIEFIKNLPTIATNIHLRCPKCHYEHDKTLVGLDDFFR